MDIRSSNRVSTFSELLHRVMKKTHLFIEVIAASTDEKMQLQVDAFIQR
jgi:hypothetical protein